MKTKELVEDCLLAANTLGALDTFESGQSILKDAAMRLTKQQKCLQWIVDNWDISHPDNILSVAKEGSEE